MARCYHGPFGRAPQHLPYRRAAMSFMRWQLHREVLQPPSAPNPGSPWWRAVNERILRDGCEAVALEREPAGAGLLPHRRTSWMAFVDDPTAAAWYRSHNGSVVAGYLEHRHLAEAENEAERFFMNVVLCRVLFTHALVAAPRLALGWMRPLAPFLGDPRLGMAGILLSLSRVLPEEYPLRDPVVDVPRHRAQLRTTGRLRRHRPAAAAALRVVGARVGRTGAARVRARRRADVCVAVRGTPRLGTTQLDDRPVRSPEAPPDTKGARHGR